MLDDLFGLSQTLIRVLHRPYRRPAFEDALSGGRFHIKGVENAWLALDNIEVGVGRRIPLWKFGFL